MAKNQCKSRKRTRRHRIKKSRHASSMNKSQSSILPVDCGSTYPEAKSTLEQMLGVEGVRKEALQILKDYATVPTPRYEDTHDEPNFSQASLISDQSSDRSLNASCETPEKNHDPPKDKSPGQPSSERSKVLIPRV